MRAYGMQASALVISLAAISTASAQKSAISSAQSSGQGVVARALIKREADWAKALVNRDSMAFRQLTVPGFVYTENAEMMTLDQVIRGMMTGEKVERASNQNMQIHEFGPVAVVTGIFVVTSRGKNGSHTIRYRFTDTWLNSAGTWKAVAAQDYVISDGPAK